MSFTIILTLLLLAALAFAGAGVAWAVARAREPVLAERDAGMRAVAGLLAVFAAICTAVAVGVAGIFAFGGALAWASYVLTAQRLGAFQIRRWRPRRDSYAERRPIG